MKTFYVLLDLGGEGKVFTIAAANFKVENGVAYFHGAPIVDQPKADTLIAVVPLGKVYAISNEKITIGETAK